MGLSALGIFHTIIGVVAIISAIISFIKNGKISLNHLTGTLYFYFTLVASLTALGLSSVKGFNPGHGLAVLIVLLASGAYYLHRKKTGNNGFRILENFLLTFSFFLSMIPTINETLTRVPVGHPLATGPQDPLVAKSLLLAFVLFIAGAVYQFIKQKRLNKSLV